MFEKCIAFAHPKQRRRLIDSGCENCVPVCSLFSQEERVRVSSQPPLSGLTLKLVLGSLLVAEVTLGFP